MDKILIACKMMEDELQQTYEKLGCEMPVRWVERGYHNSPEQLHQQLQGLIDELQEYSVILLAFGLCGNATAGLVSPKATLVIPRFDDCLNLLLCPEHRSSRAMTNTGSLYLTRGWTLDSQAVLQQYQEYVETYGEETAQDLLEMLYEHYDRITVVDTDCYPVEDVIEYAERVGRLLNAGVESTKGSARLLEQLLEGDWDDNFIVQPGGSPVEAASWDYPDEE